MKIFKRIIHYYTSFFSQFTARHEDGFYTPGQGFENRTTIPPWDEYRRAQRKFRYELANPALKGKNTRLVPLDMITPAPTTVRKLSTEKTSLAGELLTESKSANY